MPIPTNCSRLATRRSTISSILTATPLEAISSLSPIRSRPLLGCTISTTSKSLLNSLIAQQPLLRRFGLVYCGIILRRPSPSNSWTNQIGEISTPIQFATTVHLVNPQLLGRQATRLPPFVARWRVREIRDDVLRSTRQSPSAIAFSR